MTIRPLYIFTLLLGITGQAHATLFDIIAVEKGSGGFGASLFHDTSCGLMCGDNLGDITASNNGSILGFYDDVSGAFGGVFDLDGTGGPTVSFNGALSFDEDTGLMEEISFLTLTFSGIDLSGGDNIMAFTEGYQCCGDNGFDPNSFKFDDPNASYVMTLWGANGWDDGFTDDSLLGVDLRFRLVENSPGGGTVPEPSSLAMFGLGFFFLVTARLRKNRMARI